MRNGEEKATLEVPVEGISPYHIEAVVMDGKGNPVTGLEKEDFRILHSGGSYPIDMIQDGGLDDVAGHYTLYPNDNNWIFCPELGYQVRLPIGSYTLEVTVDGEQILTDFTVVD